MTIIDFYFGNAALMGSFEHSLCKTWTLGTNADKKALETAFPDYFPTDKMYFGDNDFRNFLTRDIFETAYNDYKSANAILSTFANLKEKHPDAILLFRTDNEYTSYDNDAETLRQVLELPVERHDIIKHTDGRPLRMLTFPYHRLDIYLPKIIRSGNRVAICDSIMPPAKTISKRGINNL